MNKISVIIPTYHRYDDLTNLLDLMEKQTRMADEVIIVDQTPESSMPDKFYDKYYKNLPLQVIKQNEPSSTKSRNCGGKNATGDILLFLDDKISSDEKLIENHLYVMNEEKIDVVHGAVHHPARRGPTLPDQFAWWGQREDLDPVMLFMISANSKWAGMALGVSTANVSIKKEWFEKVNGMDENMSGRWDDIEFSYRLFRAGAKIYYSTLPLIHNKRVNYGGNYNKKKKLIDIIIPPAILPNQLYVYMKHFPGWLTQQLFIRRLCGIYLKPANWFKWPLDLVLLPFKLLRSYLIAKRMFK